MFAHRPPQPKAFSATQPHRVLGEQKSLRPKPAGWSGDGAPWELISTKDRFHIRDPVRGVLTRPNGSYNFVRVQGPSPQSAQTFVSHKLGHAALAAHRPVSYAGTVRFADGALDWWSNYSGTYQPIAAFRRQAQLPDDRFVPWQKLQMGGIAMQRGSFTAREHANRINPPQIKNEAKSLETPPSIPPISASLSQHKGK